MRKRVIAFVVVAELAVVPSAYASIEATTAGALSASLSTSRGTNVAPPSDGAASPTQQSGPATGGAFFSPFATDPVKPAHKEPERAWDLSPGSADLTFSVVTSLAVVAAIACILRRASR